MTVTTMGITIDDPCPHSFHSEPELSSGCLVPTVNHGAFRGDRLDPGQRQKPEEHSLECAAFLPMNSHTW